MASLTVARCSSRAEAMRRHWTSISSQKAFQRATMGAAFSGLKSSAMLSIIWREELGRLKKGRRREETDRSDINVIDEMGLAGGEAEFERGSDVNDAGLGDAASGGDNDEEGT